MVSLKSNKTLLIRFMAILLRYMPMIETGKRELPAIKTTINYWMIRGVLDGGFGNHM